MARSAKTPTDDTVTSRHVPTLTLGLLTAQGVAEELALQLADGEAAYGYRPERETEHERISSAGVGERGRRRPSRAMCYLRNT